jgi:hypothetical protein
VRRRDLLLWFGVVALAVVGAWLVSATNPLGILGRCPLRALTGVPCPTCGGTQTVIALLALDLGKAFTASPLLTISALAFVLSGILALILLPWAERIRLPRWTKGKPFAGFLLLLVLVNWIYLIVRLR